MGRSEAPSDRRRDQRSVGNTDGTVTILFFLVYQTYRFCVGSISHQVSTNTSPHYLEIGRVLKQSIGKPLILCDEIS